MKNKYSGQKDDRISSSNFQIAEFSNYKNGLYTV